MPMQGWTPNTRHREEQQFLQGFFSLLDKVPEHRGIHQRWEREVQRARESGENCYMPHVWSDGSGYVRTLQRVQEEVSRDTFSGPDIRQLTELAARVVQRREAEYRRAKAKGKADSEHQKVLEEWKEVKGTLEAKKYRLGIEDERRAPIIIESSANETQDISILIIVLLLAVLIWIISGGHK